MVHHLPVVNHDPHHTADLVHPNLDLHQPNPTRDLLVEGHLLEADLDLEVDPDLTLDIHQAAGKYNIDLRFSIINIQL